MASILLPVPQILQNPELPNGCEITRDRKSVV